MCCLKASISTLALSMLCKTLPWRSRMALLALLPTMVLVLVLRKYVVHGLAAGAVKG